MPANDSSFTTAAFLCGPRIADGLADSIGFSGEDAVTAALESAMPLVDGASATLVYYFERPDWPTLIERYTRTGNGFYVEQIGD